MERYEVIQRLLDLFEEPAYLEIGVGEGDTFKRVRALSKTAVDPCFRFDTKACEGAFYAEASDNFFARGLGPFDVIFLDGRHTFEQTLRDFCNAVVCLSHSGVIVVDDVIPNSFHASLPNIQASRALRDALDPTSKDASWMGDVYRLVFFLDSFFQQLSFATVAENHGQLVVWRERRASVRQRRIADLAHIGFERVIFERQTFNILPLEDIVSRIASSQSKSLV